MLPLTEMHEMRAFHTFPPQGAHSFCLTANTSAQADVEAALAAMAPHASCERLEMVWHSGGRPINLVPTKRLPSLPHVRRMVVTLDARSMARLSLPMPNLEELTLPETPEMFAPLVPRAVALVPTDNGAVPFPALRRLSVAAIALVMAASTGAGAGFGWESGWLPAWGVPAALLAPMPVQAALWLLPTVRGSCKQ